MQQTTQKFGTHNEQPIQLYTLENNNGMVVKITNYGATITSINIPNEDGTKDEIVCGFETLRSYFSEPYISNAPYFGGTVGRYTSQIKDSKFILNGKEYQLAKNCGENNLHGGAKGFDKKVWEAETFETDDLVGVEMHVLSHDMEEGFPGNVSVTVTFSLNDENELLIRYLATSDANTPFSITNHTYFNLSGFETSVENHTVRIASSKKQHWDDSGAATGKILDVRDAADDLREAKKIKDVHEAINDGFEHYYIFDKRPFELEKIAVIKCEEKGRSLEVSTSEPGMLFYTGKYTSNELYRESGEQYGKYRGFCCETHRYPNGPNISDSPKSILKKGETFNSTTIFKFEW